MEYLYAVQSSSGHELVSSVIDVEKVSDVEAVIRKDGHVALKHKDAAVAVSESKGDDLKLFLHRWPADDKLSDPVTHPVD